MVEFTERARRVIVRACEQADVHRSGYIGTEHLLLGLIGDSDDAVVKALQVLGLRAEVIRRQVAQSLGPAQRARPAHLSYTSGAKKALEHSLQEAQLLGHDFVDAEHILCGLARVSDCAAAQALANLGVEPAWIRQQVSQGWVVCGVGTEIDVTRSRTVTGNARH